MFRHGLGLLQGEWACSSVRLYFAPCFDARLAPSSMTTRLAEVRVVKLTRSRLRPLGLPMRRSFAVPSWAFAQMLSGLKRSLTNLVSAMDGAIREALAHHNYSDCDHAAHACLLNSLHASGDRHGPPLGARAHDRQDSAYQLADFSDLLLG